MWRLTSALLLLSTVAITSGLDAQVLASEMASVSQTIDGTTISVNYFRPQSRGRTGLFGTRVYWGEVWTPGANAATIIKLSKDVTLEGKAVPKGSYSVWIVVQPGPWEMVLDRDTMLAHTRGPKPRPGQIRFPVNREKRPFMDALTWWFPTVSSSGATLAMHWDTVYVPLQLRVTPSYSKAVASDLARRIAGAYRVEFKPMATPGDSMLVAEREVNAADVTLTIRQQGNELHAVMNPPLYKTEDGYADWILLPTKGAWFNLGRFYKGELIEIFELKLQFDLAGETAKSFELRLPNDELFGTGTRR